MAPPPGNTRSLGESTSRSTTGSGSGRARPSWTVRPTPTTSFGSSGTTNSRGSASPRPRQGTGPRAPARGGPPAPCRTGAGVFRGRGGGPLVQRLANTLAFERRCIRSSFVALVRRSLPVRLHLRALLARRIDALDASGYLRDATPAPRYTGTRERTIQAGGGPWTRAATMW